MNASINPYYTNKISFTGRLPAPLTRTIEERATRLINLHAIAAGFSTGAVAQIPGLDYVALAGVSSHMIHKLAKLYKVPFTNELRLKSAAVLATEAACSTISDTFQYIPVVGNFGNGFLSFGLTKTTGNFFKSTFKSISEGQLKPEAINIDAFKKMVGTFVDSLKNKIPFSK